MLLKKSIYGIYFFVSASINLNSIITCTDSASSITITGTASQFLLGTNLNFAGTLKMPSFTTGVSVAQSGSGNSISFATNSSILFGNTATSAVGSIVPSGTSMLNMTGNQSYTFGPGTINMPISVSGTGNVISGAASFAQSISLANSGSGLTLNVNTPLASNIVLSSGSLTLGGDLYFKNYGQITGPGTVDCNGYSIYFSSYLTSLATNLTFSGAINTLVLNSRIGLTGTWTFSGAVSFLRGDATVLDLSGGGVLAVGAGNSLYISDVHIKGLGSTGGGNITLASSTSKIYLSNCTIELSGSYTQTQGQIIVDGANCTLLADASEIYTVSGSTSSLIINGQVLAYRTISGASTYPFATASSGTISRTNGGDIRCLDPIQAATVLSFSLPTSSGTNYLSGTADLSSSGSLTILNENTAVAKSVTLDGANNSIIFNEGSSQPFIVNQYVSLTVQNVKFQNFDPSKILLQGSGINLATITFGDNVILEFSKNITLSSNFLNFIGNSTVQGLGRGVTLSLASQAIKLTGASKTLTCRNIRLKSIAYNSIKINTSTAKLSLQGADFYMTSTGFTFDTGNLEFKDDVNIYGCHESLSEGLTTFSFTSAGIATILSGSKLKLNPDVTFLYSPNISGDGGVVSVQKRHFKTTDPSSILQLQHATIDTGSTGIAFDYGKIIVEEVAKINTPFVSGKECEIGSAVNLTVLNSGNIVINGLMKYFSSTYP